MKHLMESLADRTETFMQDYQVIADARLSATDEWYAGVLLNVRDGMRRDDKLKRLAEMSAHEIVEMVKMGCAQ